MRRVALTCLALVAVNASGNTPQTHLVRGYGENEGRMDLKLNQAIPVPSKWEGRSKRFLQGEAVVVDFRQDGEASIRWESAGIVCVPTFQIRNGLSEIEIGEGVIGSYSLRGNKLTIEIRDLHLSVQKGNRKEDASKVGIKLELIRAKQQVIAKGHVGN
jgi:hypothetical protein